MESNIKLPFGLRDGRLHHIEDVENGLRSSCKCPKCETKLVAKNQGKDKASHFSHYRTSDCPGSLETATHLMAKQIIGDELQIFTPSFENEIALKDKFGNTYHEDETLIEATKLHFDKINTEVRKEGYIPDIEAIINSKALFIEIKVTHEVDEKKKSLIRSLTAPMFEIDLSSVSSEIILDKDAFKFEVLHNVENRKWIYNPKGEFLKKDQLAKFKKKIDRIDQEYESRKQKRKYFKNLKKSKREPHLEDLEKLKSASSLSWLNRRDYNYRKECNQSIKKNFAAINYTAKYKPDIFRISVDGSWIFNTDKQVWQSGIFLKFVQGQKIGKTIRANYVKDWVVKNYGVIGFIERLNQVKQKYKRQGKKRDEWYGKEGAWFFSTEENKMILSPYKPIIQYLNYLANINILSKVDKDENKFEINFNSWDQYRTHLKKKELLKIRGNKIQAFKNRVNNLKDELTVKLNHKLVNKRIQDRITSERRVFKKLGKEGRICLNCLLYFHKKDGEICPFCEHGSFKKVTLSKGRLENAEHRYTHKIDTIKAVKAVPIIDDSLLKNI